LEYIDKKTETLFALLRLRFPAFLYDRSNPLFKELDNSAIIRELHTYGLSIPIGNRKKLSPQHQGLGRELLQKAEEIVIKEGFRKIAVTSGIGAREYYRKFGYKLQGLYMIKNL
jgi:elongator complex protein 3